MPGRELPTHSRSHMLIAHYQHCIAEEEKAISGLEKRIKEAESKINTQRKEMGGYVEQFNSSTHTTHNVVWSIFYHIMVQ